MPMPRLPTISAMMLPASSTFMNARPTMLATVANATMPRATSS